MEKILIATEKPFAPVAITPMKEIIEAAGYDCCLLEKYGSKQELLDAVSDVSAMIVRSDKVTAEVLNAAKNLKIVVRAGAGYDNVDLETATANNVVVMNTPGQNSNAVAELVIGLLLFHYRKQFDGTSGRELRGKTLGLYAYGNVAKCVARIASAFGMKVLAYNRSAIKDTSVVSVESPSVLFEQCDIVSLHIPFTSVTDKIVNAELVSKMKKNAVIVNTARKEVIDEEQLLEVFAERTDLSYLTDIAPKDIDQFTTTLGKRFFATPKKMGAQTAEANINAGIAAVKQIVAFLQNNDRTFQVNK